MRTLLCCRKPYVKCLYSKFENEKTTTRIQVYNKRIKKQTLSLCILKTFLFIFFLDGFMQDTSCVIEKICDYKLTLKTRIIHRPFIYKIGLWCLKPFSTIFKLYRGRQLYWLKKPEYPEKITDLSQVTDKLLSHNGVSSTPLMLNVIIQTHTSHTTNPSVDHARTLGSMDPKSMYVQWWIYYETNEAQASVPVIQEIPETIILK